MPLEPFPSWSNWNYIWAQPKSNGTEPLALSHDLSLHLSYHLRSHHCSLHCRRPNRPFLSSRNMCKEKVPSYSHIRYHKYSCIIFQYNREVLSPQNGQRETPAATQVPPTFLRTRNDLNPSAFAMLTALMTGADDWRSPQRFVRLIKFWSSRVKLVVRFIMRAILFPVACVLSSTIAHAFFLCGYGWK